MSDLLEHPPSKANRRDQRRQAIMEAAAELFLTKGYAATSLSDVVKRSGGSLQTLYELFGSKAGLFRDLVKHYCDQATSTLDRPGVEDLPVEEALNAFGNALLRLVMSPDAISAVRLVIAEGGQAPELVEEFFANTQDAGQARMAAYLTSQAARGRLSIDDPVLAASHYCDLVKSHYHYKAVCGIPVDMTDAEMAAHVAAAVGVFLRAYKA